jgi:predicted esterase
MKGHQGQIVRETGGLLWLNNIYNVDLTSSDYTTGFKTDLHQIADDIVQAHDPDYRLCHQQTAGGQPMVTSDSTYDVLVEENVEYGQGLTHDGISALPTAKPLLLDVYVPDNDSTNRPVYMFIHGGGFNGGSKTAAHILDMAHFFASRGWVFVSINYRTSEDIGTIHTGIVPPEWEAMITDPNNIAQGIAIYTAQRDAKAAMRWIAANAEDYQINRDFITVGGGSAGAITAITLGISNQEDFRDEISIAEDPTLLSTHLEQNYEIKSIVDFWGGNIALEILEMVYGHQRFDSEDPELLIVHGTEDPAVLFSEAEELVALYGGTGAYVELVPLFGLGHGVWNAIFEGKTLAELSFDFLVKQQKLITQTSAHDDIFKNTFE